jgi:[ribosomal protein S5]-alanine N-acetyltransferase
MLIDADTLPTIAASRVSLRWLTEQDIPALFAIFSHPEVMRYWSSPPLPDVTAAKQLLEHIHACFACRSLFQWGLVRKVEGDLIGTCTLSHLDAQNRRAELGYALGRPHWGQGYVQEGLRALLGFAFEELALHRLEADVDPRNAASVKVLERLGFSREGYLRERWIVDGEISDAVLFGLLRREWRRDA